MLTKDYNVLQYTLTTAVVVILFPFQTCQEQIGLQQKCCPLFQGCGLRTITSSPKVPNHEIRAAQHLKCYYDQILNVHFFTFSHTIGESKISCQISIYYEQQNSCFLNLSFRVFTAAINFSCSKSGLRIRENDVIFSNSQPRLGTRKINSGRKFSEIKVCS